MSPTDAAPPRGRAAEARRNRQNLIAVATGAFASGDKRVPLETIAKDAGVGIGTLYRHFPTREALVKAVSRVHERAELSEMRERLARLVAFVESQGVFRNARVTTGALPSTAQSVGITPVSTATGSVRRWRPT
jgi:AcrR family transcriptional regulator